MQLRGRVVVVTGASSGIGEAAAVAFAKRGAKVVLTARRTERLEALAERIHGAGGRALALTVDVGDPKQLDRLPGVVREMVGPADVLVNNAGVPGRGDFASLPYDSIERIVRTNVLGVLYGTRAFLPGMLARGSGHVVNIASLAGRFAAPGAAIYTATKHAVVAFSESLNYDTAPKGVLVTSVNPGFVETEAFTHDDLPPQAVLDIDDVAEAIVKVVREGIAPEYSIPRWVAPLQAFRVLTPPLYRWGVRQVRRSGHR
ncbi:MAG TPA: SDR family NAD(P)-dependent oxidoreductase [Actinomycetota bacterium]|nr:SDR family NAD(P)-dependent oxidoreductase [Actinomycetota bacterium]